MPDHPALDRGHSIRPWPYNPAQERTTAWVFGAPTPALTRGSPRGRSGSWETWATSVPQCGLACLMAEADRRPEGFRTWAGPELIRDMTDSSVSVANRMKKGT